MPNKTGKSKKPKQPFYQCPRCGYETEQKSNIMRHFYRKQKMCPASKNDIELSEDIKQHVLENRRYRVEKDSIQNTVNQFNVLNAFVNKLEFPDKLDQLLTYQNKGLIGFDCSLENYFEKRIKRLEDTSYRAPFVLKQENIIELVDKLTKIDRDHLDSLNVLFDKKLNRLKIYLDGEWSTYLEDCGVKELVSLIKSYYLDNYELYLVKNLHCDYSVINSRPCLSEHLEIYYRFLGIFDLPIHIFGMSDEEILGHRLKEDNDFYLEETYTRLYNRQKVSLKETEQKRVKRTIANIVKDNTVHNMAELNAILMQLLQIDNNLKQLLVK